MATKEELKETIKKLRKKLANSRERVATLRDRVQDLLDELEEDEEPSPEPEPEPEPEPPEPSPTVAAEFFAPDSAFNKQISPSQWAAGKPVADLIKHGGRTQPLHVPFNGTDWSHPIFYATKNDPLKEVQVDNPSWGGFNKNGKKIHLPANAKPAAFENSDADRHLVVVQPEDGSGDFPGMAFGFYDCRQISGPIKAQAAGYSHAKTGSGIDRGNITAAQFNGAAGLILAKDVKRGVIPHALFGVLNCSCAVAVPPAAPGTTATKCGSSRSALIAAVKCADVSNWPGMGSRLVLDPSYDISGFAKGQQMILLALQKYGVLIGDTGSVNTKMIFGTLAEGVNSGGSDLRAFCEQAKSEGWGSGSGDYSLDFGKGVNWSRLRLVS